MIFYNIMIWALIAAAITTIVVQIANTVLIRRRIRSLDYNFRNRIGFTEIKGFIARDDKSYEIWLYDSKPNKLPSGEWGSGKSNTDYPLRLPKEIAPSQHPDCEPRIVTVRIEVLTVEDSTVKNQPYG